jgi:hypothetical protein
MDPASPGQACRNGDFRLLLDVQPGVKLCNIDADAFGPVSEGIVLFTDELSSDGAAYRVDLAALEQAVPPAVDIPSIDPAAVMTKPGFVEHLGTWPDVSNCGAMERYSAAHAQSGNLALYVASQGCGWCNLDDPATPFVDEACGQSPCCGDEPCRCLAGDFCRQTDRHNRVILFQPGLPARTVASWMGYGSNASGLTLESRWLAWKENPQGHSDLMLYDTARGLGRRLTFHISDQREPVLGRLPDGLHLFWEDNRLGATQIFHTLVEE